MQVITNENNNKIYGTIIYTSNVIAKLLSPSGNRTPVSRVTGGDTHHYTNEEYMKAIFSTPQMTYSHSVHLHAPIKTDG